MPLGFLLPGTHRNRSDVGPSLQRTLPNCSRWEAPPGPTPDINTPHQSILAMCGSEAIYRQVVNISMFRGHGGLWVC